MRSATGVLSYPEKQMSPMWDIMRYALIGNGRVNRNPFTLHSRLLT